MGIPEKFCLRWDSRSETLTDIQKFSQFFDCTLTTDDNEAYSVNLRAHKVILSACSEFFGSMLTKESMCAHPNPLIYIKGVSTKDLQNVLNFIYKGEVSLDRKEVDHFLEIAESLKVKGLMKGPIGTITEPSENVDHHLNVANPSLEDSPHIEIGLSSSNSIEDSNNSKTVANSDENYGKDLEAELKEGLDEPTNKMEDDKCSDLTGEANATPKSAMSEVAPYMPMHNENFGHSEEDFIDDEEVGKECETDSEDGIDDPTSLMDEDESGDNDGDGAHATPLVDSETDSTANRDDSEKAETNIELADKRDGDDGSERKISPQIENNPPQATSMVDLEKAKDSVIVCDEISDTETNQEIKEANDVPIENDSTNGMDQESTDVQFRVDSSNNEDFSKMLIIPLVPSTKHTETGDTSLRLKGIHMARNGNGDSEKKYKGMMEVATKEETEEPTGDEYSESTDKTAVSKSCTKIPGTKPLQYECNFCSYKSQIWHVKRHLILMHSNEKDHECVICGIKFKSQDYMKRHIRRKHMEPKLCKCSYCGMNFKETHILKYHIVMKHRDHIKRQEAGTDIKEESEHASTQKETGSALNLVGDTTKSSGLQHFKKILDTKPAIYQCNHCTYEAKLWNVQIHFKNKHSNRRDYVCDECGKGFKTKDNLKRHIKWNHMEPKANVCMCSYCGKAFKETHSLKNHMAFKHGVTNDSVGNEYAREEETIAEIMKENENTSSQKEESATDVLGDTTKSPGLRHFKKILDTKPAIYRCSQCPYEAKLWAVQIHFKHRHSNRRDYA